uniref:Peptidase C1A papain C-terminal domain-containing protein n=1 Tax=Chromera velia CCMP2878 TaxID=1169474 RepID=A0A0G4FJ16_9ALVE|eukprot:Cvel_3370.t1-p1 / transcript=Cvel_3370.t1 / gene=Cvel_3370 / organism=Chromera_velia_CCMP2878 / gene_product=hypothetical protein / transcript_product=hypothetical protein / location=Cvel_scaffold135:54342-70432(+) / protein_length=1824 / sequence_SO=supercontig / SO=protein_coding / is_pseudo=false
MVPSIRGAASFTTVMLLFLCLLPGAAAQTGAGAVNGISLEAAKHAALVKINQKRTCTDCCAGRTCCSAPVRLSAIDVNSVALRDYRTGSAANGDALFDLHLMSLEDPSLDFFCRVRSVSLTPSPSSLKGSSSFAEIETARRRLHAQSGKGKAETSGEVGDQFQKDVMVAWGTLNLQLVALGNAFEDLDSRGDEFAVGNAYDRELASFSCDLSSGSSLDSEPVPLPTHSPLLIASQQVATDKLNERRDECADRVADMPVLERYVSGLASEASLERQVRLDDPGDAFVQDRAGLSVSFSADLKLESGSGGGNKTTTTVGRHNFVVQWRLKTVDAEGGYDRLPLLNVADASLSAVASFIQVSSSSSSSSAEAEDEAIRKREFEFSRTKHHSHGPKHKHMHMQTFDSSSDGAEGGQGNHYAGAINGTDPSSHHHQHHHHKKHHHHHLTGSDVGAMALDEIIFRLTNTGGEGAAQKKPPNGFIESTVSADGSVSFSEGTPTAPSNSPALIQEQTARVAVIQQAKKSEVGLKAILKCLKTGQTDSPLLSADKQTTPVGSTTSNSTHSLQSSTETASTNSSLPVHLSVASPEGPSFIQLASASLSHDKTEKGEEAKREKERDNVDPTAVHGMEAHEHDANGPHDHHHHHHHHHHQYEDELKTSSPDSNSASASFIETESLTPGVPPNNDSPFALSSTALDRLMLTIAQQHGFLTDYTLNENVTDVGSSPPPSHPIAEANPEPNPTKQAQTPSTQKGNRTERLLPAAASFLQTEEALLQHNKGESTPERTAEARPHMQAGKYEEDISMHAHKERKVSHPTHSLNDVMLEALTPDMVKRMETSFTATSSRHEEEADQDDSEKDLQTDTEGDAERELKEDEEEETGGEENQVDTKGQTKSNSEVTLSPERSVSPVPTGAQPAVSFVEKTVHVPAHKSKSRKLPPAPEGFSQTQAMLLEILTNKWKQEERNRKSREVEIFQPDFSDSLPFGDEEKENLRTSSLPHSHSKPERDQPPEFGISFLQESEQQTHASLPSPSQPQAATSIGLPPSASLPVPKPPPGRHWRYGPAVMNAILAHLNQMVRTGRLGRKTPTLPPAQQQQQQQQQQHAQAASTPPTVPVSPPPPDPDVPSRSGGGEEAAAPSASVMSQISSGGQRVFSAAKAVVSRLSETVMGGGARRGDKNAAGEAATALPSTVAPEAPAAIPTQQTPPLPQTVPVPIQAAGMALNPASDTFWGDLFSNALSDIEKLEVPSSAAGARDRDSAVQSMQAALQSSSFGKSDQQYSSESPGLSLAGLFGGVGEGEGEGVSLSSEERVGLSKDLESLFLWTGEKAPEKSAEVLSRIVKAAREEAAASGTNPDGKKKSKDFASLLRTSVSRVRSELETELGQSGLGVGDGAEGGNKGGEGKSASPQAAAGSFEESGASSLGAAAAAAAVASRTQAAQRELKGGGMEERAESDAMQPGGRGSDVDVFWTLMTEMDELKSNSEIDVTVDVMGFDVCQNSVSSSFSDSGVKTKTERGAGRSVGIGSDGGDESDGVEGEGEEDGMSLYTVSVSPEDLEFDPRRIPLLAMCFSTIPNEGSCASSFAVAAVTAATDTMCRRNSTTWTLEAGSDHWLSWAQAIECTAGAPAVPSVGAGGSDGTKTTQTAGTETGCDGGSVEDVLEYLSETGLCLYEDIPYKASAVPSLVTHKRHCVENEGQEGTTEGGCERRQIGGFVQLPSRSQGYSYSQIADFIKQALADGSSVVASILLSLLIDGSGFAGKSVEVSALAVSATGSSSLLLPFVRLEGAFPPLAEGVQSSDQPTSTPTDPLPEAALLLDLPPTLRSSVQGSA